MIPNQWPWKSLARLRGSYTSTLLHQITFRNASTTGTTTISNNFLHVLDPVRQALEANKPVVALESTIVAHGMPYPENLQLSQRIASILRDKGVEPATIAVRDGVCRIGLTPDELQDLAQSQGRATKCSTRELSLVMAQHQQQQQSTTTDNESQWGATTVASTMVLAHAAGIPTFVTGGIGGVHRAGQDSMDVSADLTELARTPVIVVSAGIKSILDIPRTLEVLETNGVPAVAYQTDEFPAFFSPSSGVPAPARIDSPHEIATAYNLARALHLPHGMMVAVPNEDPAGAAVEEAIQAALQEASELNISGRDVTPFILKRVAERTGGDSLRSNMKLVERNARVGADIAVALSKLHRQEDIVRPSASVPQSTSSTNTTQSALKSRVLVMGAIVQDTIAKSHSKLILHTSNLATSVVADGGVARNIAEALGRLGSRPTIYSAVGNDTRGKTILTRLEEECNVQFGVGSSVNVVDGENTASYVAILDEDGELHTACAEKKVLEHIAVPSTEVLREAEYLIVDANPPIEVLRSVVEEAHRLGVKVVFEPTSVPKAAEIGKHKEILSCFTMASPNVEELCAMVDGWDSGDDELAVFERDQELIHDLCRRLLEKMSDTSYLLVTMGAKGLIHASKDGQDSPVEIQHYEVPDKDTKVVNSTGAGDTLTGAFIHSLLEGSPMETAIVDGMKSAALTVSCADHAVSPLLSEIAASKR